MGRALDLRRAFKQLPAKQSSQNKVIVCIWHPVMKRPVFYELRAAPFGARNVVYQVGAVAKVLHIILTRLFGLLVCQYVDDFPQLEPEALGSTGVGPEDVLALLAWEVKQIEEEIPRLSLSFICLGVKWLLACTNRGLLEITLKPGRVERVQELVDQICTQCHKTTKHAEVLQGVLGFARAQCFGKCGAVALRTVNRIAAGELSLLTDDLMSHLQFWPGSLKTSKHAE